MILRSYHNHTVHCDGKNTAEEMTQAAIRAGMQALGFSGHATFLPDLRYCTRPDGFPAYIEAVKACREKYAGQIEIYQSCGHC